jgi:hypothetical protein
VVYYRSGLGGTADAIDLMPFGTPKTKLKGAAATSAAKKRGAVSPEGNVKKLIDKFEGGEEPQELRLNRFDRHRRSLIGQKFQGSPPTTCRWPRTTRQFLQRLASPTSQVIAMTT